MAAELQPIAKLDGPQEPDLQPIRVHGVNGVKGLYVANITDVEADLDKAIAVRADDIERSVSLVLERKETAEYNLAGYTSDDEKLYPFGYVEHSAILLYLQQQGLLDAYYGEYERNVAEDDPVSWRVLFAGNRGEIYAVKGLAGVRGGREYKLTVQRRL